MRLPDDDELDDEYDDDREDLELDPLLLEELSLSLVYDELDDEYDDEPLRLLDLDVDLDREPELELELELGDRRRLFFFSDLRFSRPPLSKTFPSRRSTPSRAARPSSSASGTASPANCSSANFCRNFGSRSLSLALARRTYADAAPSFPHPHSYVHLPGLRQR